MTTSYTILKTAARRWQVIATTPMGTGSVLGTFTTKRDAVSLANAEDAAARLRGRRDAAVTAICRAIAWMRFDVPQHAGDHPQVFTDGVCTCGHTTAEFDASHRGQLA